MSESRNKIKIREIAGRHGGYLRMIDAINAGVSRSAFYALRDEGELEKETRGLYRLSDAEFNPNPDLAIVALKIPHAVVALISALSFHDITTQIPHRVHICIPKGMRSPKLDYPPIVSHQVRGEAFSGGIENHDIGGVNIRIYSIEKTIADCFKFEKHVGFDVALEAMKTARAESRLNIPKLHEYARICRVYNRIRPYIEAII
jgi:predicted transcriptional regulator of viral defense system